jgi:GNAT superfamily N-acetyltransferase
MSCDPTNTTSYAPACLPTEEPAIEPVNLRRATPADAAALALVGAATFLEAFTWMLPGADIIAHCAKNHTPEAYAHYLADPSTRITLATVGLDTPVGYAMLSAPDLPSMDIGIGDIELKRIYLFSRFRSKATPVINPPAGSPPNIRVAQALLDAAIADARAMNKTRLLLGTNEGNSRAIGFYRRNGFTEAGRRTFQVGTQQCCDLIMARGL